MLQAPPGVVVPELVQAVDEPSRTPATNILGVTVHSGDILVSRGGAPTSALIARGNDYPGSFSHVALLRVDERSGQASVVESHIERGVVVASVEDYLKDKKLRVLVLRLRADLPALRRNPMLPHAAATTAWQNARRRHIPYDFAMNYLDHQEQFCSEVVSAAYEAEGLKLWTGPTYISSPTVVAGPCPGNTAVAGSSVYNFVRMLLANVSKSAAGKSVRPIEPAKSASPAMTSGSSLFRQTSEMPPGECPGV